MTKFYRNLVSLTLTTLFFTTSISYAQKSLQDVADLNDKKWNKLVKSYKNNSTWIDQLQGLLNEDLLSESNLPNPKKIGVLTVQIWDKSLTTSSKIGNTTLYTTNYLTPSGSNLVADKFLSEMLPIFKNQLNNFSKFSEINEYPINYSSKVPTWMDCIVS